MPIAGMNINQAMVALQAGNHVSRVAWGGTPFLSMTIPIDFTTGRLTPYVYINTVPGVPWNPTPADIAATDWEIVP